MSFTKTKIYNLALSHLLLSRQVIDVDTDTVTNEVRTLNTFWETALNDTLRDLDLDSLSEEVQLELIEKLNDEQPWNYIYKYPSRCSFLRRLVSNYRIDNSSTHIPKKTATYNSEKVIYTNQEKAKAEIIPEDINLEYINSSTALAISYMLAYLSAPLIVGKGAITLKQQIQTDYLIAKSKAQEVDALENFNYDNPAARSEFVRTRIS